MQDDAATRPEIGETVLVDGIRTNFHDMGSGDPVVLVHGSGPGASAWANWRLTLPALSEQFRVLAPDVFGFGYTERPGDARYDLDVWTGHLVGFLDALDLERVSFVGNSFGVRSPSALPPSTPRVSRSWCSGQRRRALRPDAGTECGVGLRVIAALETLPPWPTTST